MPTTAAQSSQSQPLASAIIPPFSYRVRIHTTSSDQIDHHTALFLFSELNSLANDTSQGHISLPTRSTYTPATVGVVGDTAIATNVNTAALIRPVRSVLKFKRPIASPPRTTVKLSHDKNVRSLAKKTDPCQNAVNWESDLLVQLGLGGQCGSL